MKEEGEGGVGEARSYDRKKAWSSIYLTILSEWTLYPNHFSLIRLKIPNDELPLLGGILNKLRAFCLSIYARDWQKLYQHMILSNL